MIGEHGPEEVNLPAGAVVISHIDAQWILDAIRDLERRRDEDDDGGRGEP